MKHIDMRRFDESVRRIAVFFQINESVEVFFASLSLLLKLFIGKSRFSVGRDKTVLASSARCKQTFSVIFVSITVPHPFAEKWCFMCIRQCRQTQC